MVDHISNNQINIEVIDNGSGISDIDALNMFKPFFSTKKDKGCGYGLSVSKHIIEKYFNGEIVYKNNRDDLTTALCVTIPLNVS